MMTVLSVLGSIVLILYIISMIVGGYLSYKFIKQIMDEDSKA
jgi:uncharacterized protein YneF (UPF0154 family)